MVVFTALKYALFSLLKFFEAKDAPTIGFNAPANPNKGVKPS